MAKDKLSSRFRNVILCDDIRQEVGNKRSLMGVFSGDIIVAEFPARIRFSLYVEYRSGADNPAHDVTLTLYQNKETMAEVTIGTQPTTDITIMLIPQGLGTFAKECDFSIKASAEGRTVEILRKKVMHGTVAPR